MANNTNLVLQLLITARDQAGEIISRTGAAVRGIGQAASDALAPLKTFGGLIAGAIGVAGTAALQERSDTYIRLTNALKVATKTEEDYKAALDAVTGIAQRTHSDLETTASLYARISQNAEKMNINQAQVNDLTEVISKGMQLGGASASEYASATLQLTQSFGSGVLRGEEFNAVMEASPVLMQRIADGIGVAVGELRGLAEQGKLTAGIVTQALLSQKGVIDKSYAEMTVTVAQAFGDLSNKVTIFIGELFQVTGASAGAVARMKFLAENINAVAFAIGAGLVGAAAKGVHSLGTYVAASLAARQAAIDQAVATAAQTEATIAAAAANVAAAQGAYNRALAEQRATAAQLAAIESLAGLFAAEEALVAARAQAAVAANNATAASARYTAAQQALATANAGVAASTTLMGRAMSFLTGPGGLILLAVGAFAGLVAMMGKSKTATDDLTGSTDSYAESIKKMNEQQLKGQQIRLDEAIDRQRAVVEKATAAGWEYADFLDESTGKIERVYRNSIDLALAQEKLANETDKLKALEEKRTAVLDALNSKKELAAGVDAKALTQYVQQGVAMDKLAISIETLSKQQDAVTKANQARIVAEIALAVAAGDLQKVDALNLQLAQEKAKASAQQATLDNAAAGASAAKVTAIEAEYEGYKKISPVQAKTLADAKADADAKAAQAKASAAVAEQLGEQARQTALLNTAQKEQLLLQERLYQAIEKLATIETEGATAALAIAKARGDGNAIAQESIKLIEAQAKAQAAEAKAADQAAAALVIKRDELIAQAGGYGQLTDSQKAQADTLNQEIVAIFAGVDALQQKRIAQQLEIANSDTAIKAAQDQTEAEKALAESKDDLVAASKAVYEGALLEVDALDLLLSKRQAEIAALVAQRQAVIDQAGGLEKLNALQQAQVAALDLLINAKDRDIAATQKDIELAEQQAKQAGIMAGPVGQLTRLYEDQRKERERGIDASARYHDAQVTEAEGALKLAQIKGDQQAIDEAQAKLDDAKIEQAQALSSAKALELNEAVKLLEAKKLELAADGELTQADKEQLAALEASVAAKADAANAAQQNAEQLQDEADAMKAAAEAAAELKKEQEAAAESARQAAKAAGLISDAYNGAIGSMAGLSEAAVAEFKRLRGEIVPTGNDLEALRNRTDQLASAINAVGASGGGLAGFLTGIAADANEVNKAFLGQAEAAERLTDQLSRVGAESGLTGGALEALIRQAEGSVSQFNLLDQARLDNLQSEIENANQKLREMQEETQSAQDRIAELNAEIAAERGDSATADRLKLQLEQQQAIAEVTAAIEAARNANNRELIALYEEQKRKLEELYALREKNLEADIKTRDTQTTNNRATTTSGGNANASNASGKTYTLNLNANGRSLAATTQTDPSGFLAELERAQRSAA